MLISDLHSSTVIGCGGELNQSECLHTGQKSTEGCRGAERGTKGYGGGTERGMEVLGLFVACSEFTVGLFAAQSNFVNIIFLQL